MPRRIRIQFPDARYHVINRGNFRQPVFATAGAAAAFERTLAQAVERYRWRTHAYVVLSNHFHLAIQTPEPNLAEGMHWLLTTFCSRHNRFRGRHGHLFQGRYKALLIQDETHLRNVVDYIHLNPVRAQLVGAAAVGTYRPSSLWWLLQANCPAWLATPCDIDPASRCEILVRLTKVVELGNADERMCRGAYSTGWAIGTAGWRKALAKEYALTNLCPGLELDELKQMKRDVWQRELDAALAAAGKDLNDAQCDLKGAAWKITLARRLRETANAPYSWIADALHMGAPSSVRAYLASTSV